MPFFSANFMHRPPQEDEHQPPSTPNPILHPFTPQEFHGVASFLGKRSVSFSGTEMGEGANNGEDDLADDGSMAGEKKRRLNTEQVKTLEKSFELGNKLEPQRKLHLARALNLQPRQIAIWFQNRRARWKTKQLEKDYDLLKRQFDAIKADNEALRTQNQKLHAEILSLKSGEPTESINLNKETEGSSSNRSENSSDIKLDISRTAAIDSPLQTSRSLLSAAIRAPSVAQIFQNQSRSELHCHKSNQLGKEEILSNMFCGIEDQSSGLWPWLENQNFN